MGVLVLRRNRTLGRAALPGAVGALDPLLGVLSCLGADGQPALGTWERLLVWLLLGLAIFFS